MEPEYICAVWYLDDWGAVDYELCETFDEAARTAGIMDSNWTICGVQHADGRIIPAAEWIAFAEERASAAQKRREARENPPPPLPTRLAVDPFKGIQIDIETSEPEWLGRQE